MEFKEPKTLEEIKEISRNSLEPMVLEDGKVVFLGKVFENEEVFIKRYDSLARFTNRLGNVLRFVSFGKIRIPYRFYKK